MKLSSIAILAVFASACALSPAPTASVPGNAEIIAEAQGFMASYARDLLAGDRKAIAQRYDQRGAYFLGSGQKEFVPYAQIVRDYESQGWSAPATFEWQNLSFEPLSPDAIAVLGKFVASQPGREQRTTSYTGILRRQDGVLRILVEDESRAPDKP